MAPFRLVGRVASATAGLAMAEGFLLEPNAAFAGPPGTQVTAGLDLVSSAVYLDAFKRVDDSVAMESGRLGVWSAAPVLGALALSAEVPALRAQLSQLIHRRVPAPHEVVQRALRRQRQTSLSASAEAAKSPSAEVAEVEPRRRTPGLVMAGLLAAAGVPYMARRRRVARVVSRANLVILAPEEFAEAAAADNICLCGSPVSTPQKVSVKSHETMPSTSPGRSLTMSSQSSQEDLQEEAEAPSTDGSESSRTGYGNGYVRQLASEINKGTRQSAASWPQPRQIEFHRIMTEGSNLSTDDSENAEMPELPDTQFYRIGTEKESQSLWIDKGFSRIKTETSLPINRSNSFISGGHRLDTGVSANSTAFTRMRTEPSLR